MNKNADRIPGVIGLIFSVIVVEESLRLPKQAATEETSLVLGTGFLPFWAGLFLAIFSIILIVSSYIRTADFEKKAIFPDRQALTSILLFMVGLAAYIFLLDVLGYLVGTFLFMIFLMHVVMRAKWKLSLWIPMLASVSLYVVFQVILGVNLPKNMFGF